MNKHFTDFGHFDGPTFYFPFATVFKIHTADNQKEYLKQPAAQHVFLGDAFCVEGCVLTTSSETQGQLVGSIKCSW